MIRFVLDTNVISEPLAARPNAGVLGFIDRHAGECAIAAPVLHELRFGAARLPASRRRTAIETYIEQVVLKLFPVLPYDQTAAEWHASERARLARLGKPAPVIDAIIASIAATTGAALVTSNVKDFRVFKGLRLVEWRS